MATTSGSSASTATSVPPQCREREAVEMRLMTTSARTTLRAIVLTLAALALAGGVASGCGGGDDEATNQPTTTAPATTTGGGQAMSGAQIFADNCQTCHGPEGAGGHVGPDLQKSSVAENL